jgi:hypothetical protein
MSDKQLKDDACIYSRHYATIHFCTRCALNKPESNLQSTNMQPTIYLNTPCLMQRSPQLHHKSRISRSQNRGFHNINAHTYAHLGLVESSLPQLILRPCSELYMHPIQLHYVTPAWTAKYAGRNDTLQAHSLIPAYRRT